MNLKKIIDILRNEGVLVQSFSYISCLTVMTTIILPVRLVSKLWLYIVPSMSESIVLRRVLAMKILCWNLNVPRRGLHEYFNNHRYLEEKRVTLLQSLNSRRRRVSMILSISSLGSKQLYCSSPSHDSVLMVALGILFRTLAPHEFDATGAKPAPQDSIISIFQLRFVSFM